MNLYDLPRFNFLSGIKSFLISQEKKKSFRIIALIVFISVVFGFLAGAVSSTFFYFQIKNYLEKLNINLPPVLEKETTIKEYVPQTSDEKKIIDIVKEFSPAVVSIIVTKDLSAIEQYYSGARGKQEIGGGSGFIVSEDGLILTNKHVVLDEGADYTVLTNDGKKFKAKILARDPLQDLAVLKVDKAGPETFAVVKLGDSDNLESGQTVIAIGNALGEFRNTVSVGVISGLGRKITASGGGFVEILEDVIQTDAAINKGNSGGPLLNLKGEVIGINTAMVIGAQSIGFAVPINKAKRDIEQIKDSGKITYPFLGIRYVLINEEIKAEKNLSVDYGVFIVERGSGEPAIEPDSAADKAGLKAGDIVLEFNKEKITTENTLAKIIIKYNPGDKVVLKILRGEKEMTIEVVLGERSG